MSKDPEDRDWKIDKYISKYKAAYPNKESPSYEEVGKIIDKWDSMNRHITYPMAGVSWNQIEWQRERYINQYIKKNFPEATVITPLIKPYIKRITLPDETERIIEFNKKRRHCRMYRYWKTANTSLSEMWYIFYRRCEKLHLQRISDFR